MTSRDAYELTDARLALSRCTVPGLVCRGIGGELISTVCIDAGWTLGIRRWLMDREHPPLSESRLTRPEKEER